MRHSSADTSSFLITTFPLLIPCCWPNYTIHVSPHVTCPVQEKLLGQSQWKDYSGPMGPPPGHAPAPYAHQQNYGYDAFETEEPKLSWGARGDGGAHNQSSRARYERYAAQQAGNTHSLPRGKEYAASSAAASHYPMGYSSFDRRGGHGGGGGVRSVPAPDYPPPDHYFMPSQRKHSGTDLRVYVDYNK